MRKNYIIDCLHAWSWGPGAVTLCAAVLAVAQFNPAMADETHVLAVGEQVMASQAVYPETAGDTVRYAGDNNPYALAINHDGLIRANGAQIVNGRVFLTAGPGVVHVTSDSAAIEAGTTEFTNTVNHDGKDILLQEGHPYTGR